MFSIVACLRRDSPLAEKAALTATDLQENLTVLYHPQRHPDAHELLLNLLTEVGVTISDYSLASHPTEMQMLVKEGYGFTLIREGTPLDEELTIRPIAGVNWAVNTAVIYHKQRYPKTVPILVKKFRRHLRSEPSGIGSDQRHASLRTSRSILRQPESIKSGPVQMTFLSRKP